MRIIPFIIAFIIIHPGNGLCAKKVFYQTTTPDSTYFGNAVVSYTIQGKKTTIKNILQTEGENIKALHLNVVSLIPKTGLVEGKFYKLTDP